MFAFMEYHFLVFSLLFTLAVVAITIAFISILTFYGLKSNKKARHPQNKSLLSLLRNFLLEISFGRHRLAGALPLF